MTFSRIIDDMPSQRQVEEAANDQIVAWHLFLRPTMSNEELPIIKAIARRYENMPSSLREEYAAVARRRRECA